MDADQPKPRAEISAFAIAAHDGCLAAASWPMPLNTRPDLSCNETLDSPGDIEDPPPYNDVPQQ